MPPALSPQNEAMASTPSAGFSTSDSNWTSVFGPARMARPGAGRPPRDRNPRAAGRRPRGFEPPGTRSVLVASYLGGLEMRACGAVLALALLPVWAAADEKVAKPLPLTPEAAAKKVKEKCTVEMVVKSTGKSGGVYFLNSKENYRDADNFVVFINAVGAGKLKEAKVEDPVTHFKGKTIRVTGVVELYRDKPEIVVEKVDQIQVVEKK
jgi:hypothetical protein